VFKERDEFHAEGESTNHMVEFFKASLIGCLRVSLCTFSNVVTVVLIEANR
jgi:hypothetical protein